MDVWPILAVVIVFNLTYKQVLTFGVINKCCDQGHSLNGTSCVPTNHVWLYMNFTYGLPNCKDPTILRAEENDTATCIDNDIEIDTVMAIKCKNDSPQVVVPPVNYLRKCCPIKRGYDTADRACWSHRADYHQGLPQDLVNVLIPGYEGVVDIKTGPPECPLDHVLVDHLVLFSRVRREQSESVVIELRDGKRELLLNPDEACLDLTERLGILVLRACQHYWTVCRPRGKLTCMRKCCPEGESYFGKDCIPTNETLKPIEIYDFNDDHQPVPVMNIRPSLIMGDVCPLQKYLLNPADYDFDQYELDMNGDIHLGDEISDVNSYCMEHVRNGSDDIDDGQYVFVCFPEGDEQMELTYTLFNSFCMIVSCVFLVFTLIVYSCLPHLRNLHGKTLMCHVACLLIAYSLLASVQLSDERLFGLACTVIGYLIQFIFLAAFFWLNVISFDIWWTFGSMQSAIGKKKRDRRRFIIYSVYAWTMASFFSAGALVADTTDILPEYLRPGIGSSACWFSTSSHGIIIFFVGPESVLFAANALFFALTAIHCSKVKGELHKVAHSSLAEKRFQSDKRKLVMNCKLFVVMGVSWTLEVISWFITSPEELWYVSDAANALQGLLIFAIFVMKKRVLKAFRRRLLQVLCRHKTKEHRPSCSTMFTVMPTESGALNHKLHGSSMTHILPEHHRLRKSISDSHLSAHSVQCSPLVSPKRNLHHRCMSSSPTMSNRLNVNHH